VHKAQGTTLDRAVADISGRDFQAGLSYVAVSRVKSLQGIMFDAYFDIDHLRARTSATFDSRARDIERRAGQVIHPYVRLLFYVRLLS
jgi:ATP-dependent exoDNAse (exonuclease V) alpha subunit